MIPKLKLANKIHISHIQNYTSIIVNMADIQKQIEAATKKLMAEMDSKKAAQVKRLVAPAKKPTDAKKKELSITVVDKDDITRYVEFVGFGGKLTVEHVDTFIGKLRDLKKKMTAGKAQVFENREAFNKFTKESMKKVD